MCKRHLSKAYFWKITEICINYVSVEISFLLLFLLSRKKFHSIFLKYLFRSQKEPEDENFLVWIRFVKLPESSVFARWERRFPADKFRFEFHIVENSCWASDVRYACGCENLTAVLTEQQICVYWLLRRNMFSFKYLKSWLESSRSKLYRVTF